MKKIITLAVLMLVFGMQAKAKKTQEKFPDGTIIPAWFSDTTKVDVNKLGLKYVITDYGVQNDSTIVQTEAIQAVIDKAAAQGGGVVVVPRGTFLTGSLFFRQGTHLYLSEGGTIKGVDAISHYKILTTRLEGQTITYFAALVNADGIDGFTISGTGTINGNGKRFWDEFWIRRKINKDCTNLEAMRPRLVYISNCKNVQLQDAHFINSAFWTTHIYHSEKVKLMNLYIFAPHLVDKAPSSDAIDVDVCRDVLIHGCYMSVNDDAVALKGGKGTFADKAPDNGPNENVIIENCRYGFVHGCLTLGSESVHDRNIILRRTEVHNANRILWLKMRPDTPQNYEYVRVEDITGDAVNVLFVRPWTQFFKPEKRDDMPESVCSNITMKNMKVKCQNFFNVGASDKYKLKNFTFENLDIQATGDAAFDYRFIDGSIVKNVKINER